MLHAGLGILAALSFVLGLIALAVWLLRRWGTGPLRPRHRLPVEVVQRLPLGPKAALAVVRVGEKVLVVSHGEGGIQTVCDLDEADRQRVLASSEVAVPFASSPSAQRQMSAAAAPPFLHAFRSALGTMTPPAPAVPPTVAPVAAAPLAVAPAAGTPVAAQPAPRPARGTAPRGTPSPPPVAPRVPPDHPLRSALAMTLTPATRLLGLLAFAALAAFRPIDAVHAQPAPAGGSAATTAPAAAGGATATVAPAPATRPAAPAAPAAAAPAPAPATATTAPAPATATPARTPATATPAPAPATAPAGALDALTAGQAAAQVLPQLDLRLGAEGAQELRLNGTVGIVLMMGLLTLVPTLLLMMTGFTRILIVLHFLKQAMGTQSAPPAHLVAGLALLLTGFVMAPTITEANRTALQPWLAGEMEQVDMLKEGVKPFRAFMLRQTSESDLRTFVGLSRSARPATPDDVPLHVLMAAFVSSELRTAFQIGFAIYLPFIVIDAVVASVLMAMGMFMLPPAMISLPFKLLLFVLVDGWSLTIQSLIQSFR
jgi:flagellar biosynthetic protein FliP